MRLCESISGISVHCIDNTGRTLGILLESERCTEESCAVIMKCGLDFLACKYHQDKILNDGLETKTASYKSLASRGTKQLSCVLHSDTLWFIDAAGYCRIIGNSQAKITFAKML